MDLTLDDNQTALQDELRRFLGNELSPERRRAMAALPGGIDPQFWQQLGDMGVFSLTVPEDHGGIGLGMTEAVIVFEELGRALVPGPLAATFLSSRCGFAAGPGTPVVGAIEFGREHSPGGGGNDLIIENLSALDQLLVFGSDVTVSDPPPGRLVVRPLDPMTPVHHVLRSDLQAGRTLGGAALAEEMRSDGSLLTSALQVGLAQTAVDLAANYAKSRQQFGRVIGSFQALKHLLADAASWTEIARAGVYAAAVAVDEAAQDALISGDPVDVQAGRSALGTAIASARIVASRSTHLATSTSIQVHGGMGYTWEVEAQLLFKRSLVLDQAFGGVGRAEQLLESMLQP